jgi:hypothetical protein
MIVFSRWCDGAHNREHLHLASIDSLLLKTRETDMAMLGSISLVVALLLVAAAALSSTADAQPPLHFAVCLD